VTSQSVRSLGTTEATQASGFALSLSMLTDDLGIKASSPDDDTLAADTTAQRPFTSTSGASVAPQVLNNQHVVQLAVLYNLKKR